MSRILDPRILPFISSGTRGGLDSKYIITGTAHITIRTENNNENFDKETAGEYNSCMKLRISQNKTLKRGASLVL